MLIKAIANKANCKPATGKSYKVSPHTCNMLHDKPADDKHNRDMQHALKGQWGHIACLSPTALVRVQARDSCPAGGRATRASTSAWMVGRCQPVWTVTAGLDGVTWRSAGHRAACWLLRLSRCLAVTATLATPYIPATQCF